ncbi:RDD family protein [Chryseobacterium sp. RP-3-3]|uniref:RDD family protein n=1 Tax=Chryseobacterium antibioticum TaxID=2728847 RepID=A0A7Y0FRS9_9FLAO|nr:RDD family protein [Chryseobacterium antibioticum]NML69946.1 RDD family protein [Chryseobacterium antibioticum]
MKVSELKDRRIIRRPTRQFDEFGYRIYNSFEYDFPYDATYKGNERERFFAKLIDILPFFLIFFFLFEKIAIISFLYSIPCVIITGTICEWYWGTTLGKSVFKIKVIDDFANSPGLLLSLKRNFLCLANFHRLHSSSEPHMGKGRHSDEFQYESEQQDLQNLYR